MRRAVCEDDGWAIDPATIHGYKVFDHRLTWEAARSQCAEIDAHVAVLATDDEAEFVRPLVAAPTWIGATDAEIEGEFTWVTGEPFADDRFAADQPDDGGGLEDCVEMQADGAWYDGRCDQALPYICEAE